MALGGSADSSQSDDFVDLAVKRPCLRDPPPKLKDNDIIEIEEEELEDLEEEEDEDDVQVFTLCDFLTFRVPMDAQFVSSHGLHPGSIAWCRSNVDIYLVSDVSIDGSQTQLAQSVLNAMLLQSAAKFVFYSPRS